MPDSDKSFDLLRDIKPYGFEPPAKKVTDSINEGLLLQHRFATQCRVPYSREENEVAGWVSPKFCWTEKEKSANFPSPDNNSHG
ncbi:hypothetical protein LSH36_1333g00018 [Paralvinella palmiformis]|uniref:Uncharacterized protein n=1 Tax=Paralvinella palmiformis TaxID=53620 RepID=A0AAD9ITN2_9ANNE|nr:hypothetical protein LSH36_1333g00018 [Paralvinella palmiformis]